MHGTLPNAAPDKKSVRAQIRSLLRISLEESFLRSEQIRAQVVGLPVWKAAQTVALFHPFEEEPDLLELMNEPEKRFVFPAIEAGRLVWRQVAKRSDLRPRSQIGQRTLWEPEGTPELNPADIDCLFVPGLAFTQTGERLGRGGGFYDRTLAAQERRATAVGVCFSFQVLPSLPLEAHDMPVDCLVHA